VGKLIKTEALFKHCVLYSTGLQAAQDSLDISVFHGISLKKRRDRQLKKPISPDNP